jgi:hypothetical protein
MNTKADYLNYVHAVLKSIPDDIPAVASYDTGFGIHIVDESLGDCPVTLFVIQHSIAKVRPPIIQDFDQWYEAWLAGKDLVNKFVEDRSYKFRRF